MSKLYSKYIENCNINKLISEHATQTSLTRFISKSYLTERRKLNGRFETLLLNFDWRSENIISTTIINPQAQVSRLQAQITLNVITDPIKLFFTETLREFKTGYTVVKRLYDDLCNHCVKNNKQCQYASQRAFTMDLNKKYGYTVINKYYEGKYRSVIRGYIYKDDLGRENLNKAVKSSMHKSNHRKILKAAILVDDPRVRPILDMVNQGQGITHDQFVLMIRGACGLEKTTRIVEYIRQNSDVLKKISTKRI